MSRSSSRPPQPWHQRVWPIREGRAQVLRRFYRVMRAAHNANEGRRVLTATLGDLLDWRPEVDRLGAAVPDPPYGELGRARPTVVSPSRRPIFITARFRSGSTLLWNLFRHVTSCTSFYEPLNERRWWDAAHRGNRLDTTHRHVDDYWREYDGLTELGAYYDDDWTLRRLYMDARSWDPAMAAFIRTLVARAPGRPVLQFNRVDFRLGWLAHMFPDAALVHLYRHPRDQWCSSLVKVSAVPPTATLATFKPNDHFYLLDWAADLRARFPFLNLSPDTHPYRLFYFVWKLSYLFGAHQAHYSLSLETLLADPAAGIRRLFEAVDLEVGDLGALTKIVEAVPSRWPTYAPDDWFKAHETACEEILADFFRGTPFAPSAGPCHVGFTPG